MTEMTDALDELGEDDPVVLAAHLEGMRALCGWEGDGSVASATRS